MFLVGGDQDGVGSKGVAIIGWVGGALRDGALAAGWGGIRSWTHSTNEEVVVTLD